MKCKVYCPVCGKIGTVEEFAKDCDEMTACPDCNAPEDLADPDCAAVIYAYPYIEGAIIAVIDYSWGPTTLLLTPVEEAEYGEDIFDAGDIADDGEMIGFPCLPGVYKCDIEVNFSDDGESEFIASNFEHLLDLSKGGQE